MNLRNPSRYKLSLIAPSLFSIVLIVFVLFSRTSTVEAAPKKTPTPAPTIALTSTPIPNPPPNVPGTWKVVNSPSISFGSNTLRSVAVVSANDVWAVGNALIEHWDSTAWSIVPSPNPGDSNNYYGTITNELYGVAAVSASDVWAVGMYGKPDGLNVTAQTLVERYTGP